MVVPGYAPQHIAPGYEHILCQCGCGAPLESAGAVHGAAAAAAQRQQHQQQQPPQPTAAVAAAAAAAHAHHAAQFRAGAGQGILHPHLYPAASFRAQQDMVSVSCLRRCRLQFLSLLLFFLPAVLNKLIFALRNCYYINIIIQTPFCVVYAAHYSSILLVASWLLWFLIEQFITVVFMLLYEPPTSYSVIVERCLLRHFQFNVRRLDVQYLLPMFLVGC